MLSARNQLPATVRSVTLGDVMAEVVMDVAGVEATGAVCAALAWPLAYVFTLNAAVAWAAALPLALHMATLPIKGWAMVSMAPIRASGDTRFSMTVGIVTSALVIPVSYACIRIFHIGLYGVPVSWIFAWLARSALTYVKLRDGSWTRRRLAGV